jgi:hypothetical protein
VYKNGTCNNPQYDLRSMVYYSSQVFSTEFANAYYNCYLFSASVEKVVTTRLNTFSDFADLYTSFLFNLLSNSLSIKTITTNIQSYSNSGSYSDLYGEFAKLFRIMLDFESSNAASRDNSTLKIDDSLKKSINIKANYVDDFMQNLLTQKLEVA